MARIKGVDIPNEKHIVVSLTYIYGIGRNLAKTICKNANVEETKKAKAKQITYFSFLKKK